MKLHGRDVPAHDGTRRSSLLLLRAPPRPTISDPHTVKVNANRTATQAFLQRMSEYVFGGQEMIAANPLMDMKALRKSVLESNGLDSGNLVHFWERSLP